MLDVLVDFAPNGFLVFGSLVVAIVTSSIVTFHVNGP